MIDLVIPLIFIYLPYIIFSFLSNFSYVEEKITQNIVKYVFRVISILISYPLIVGTLSIGNTRCEILSGLSRWLMFTPVIFFIFLSYLTVKYRASKREKSYRLLSCSLFLVL
ncbi:hypothetical protein ICE98_00681 [Lactococcus lactis]|nr:hypothetical protein [Lactococcus lactis]